MVLLHTCTMYREYQHTSNVNPVTAAGRRGVPLQHKANDEGATDWGQTGVAPGLWVN